MSIFHVHSQSLCFGLFIGLLPKTHKEASPARNSPVKTSYWWVIPLVVVIEEAGKDLIHQERIPVNIKFRSTVKTLEFWDFGRPWEDKYSWQDFSNSIGWCLATMVNRLTGWHYKWQPWLGPRMWKSSAGTARTWKGRGGKDLCWPANKSQCAAKGRAEHQWSSSGFNCSIDCCLSLKCFIYSLFLLGVLTGTDVPSGSLWREKEPARHTLMSAVHPAKLCEFSANSSTHVFWQSFWHRKNCPIQKCWHWNSWNLWIGQVT